MTMTRKNYNAMVKVIASEVAVCANTTHNPMNPAPLLAVARVVVGFMNHAYDDNHRFDGAKFIHACGLQGLVVWDEGGTSKNAQLVD
jgi:hypothetical protein